MEQEVDHRWWPRWSRGRTGFVATIGVGLAVMCIVVGVVWLTPDRARGRPVEILQIQPIRKPPVTPGDLTWLPDHAPVIGVTAGNRHRAYAIAALWNIDDHVVNDVVGGVPVTVAYCNRTECTKVFTSPSGNQPLEVAVGGFVGTPGSSLDGAMLLRLGSSYYLQDTGEQLSGWSSFPYPEAEFERTTWCKWRKAHPDTDVVSGPRGVVDVAQ